MSDYAYVNMFGQITKNKELEIENLLKRVCEIMEEIRLSDKYHLVSIGNRHYNIKITTFI